MHVVEMFRGNATTFPKGEGAVQRRGQRAPSVKIKWPAWSCGLDVVIDVKKRPLPPENWRAANPHTNRLFGRFHMA
jgi:hypothetical protein